MKRRKQTRSRDAIHRRSKAATEDVLGTQRRPRIPAKWRRHYGRLIRLRDELLQRQGELNRDALEERPSYSTHMADAATDTYDRDLALGILSSEQDAVYGLEQAIDRIQNGTYGICELTGKPIEPARLEAIPWTRFSAAAEKKIEKEGITRRTRLGPRMTVTRQSTATAAEEEE